MKKVLVFIVAVALMMSTAVPAFAAQTNDFIFSGEVTAISQSEYKAFDGVADAKGKTEFTANNSVFAVSDGISLVSDNKTKGAEAWYLNVTKDLVGTIQVAYKISSGYYLVEFAIDGVGKYFIGAGNAVNMCKVGAFVDGSVIEEPVEVNLGFIGYYVYDGVVMSTSIHWQNLSEGDLIDWDAVDAAYADWMDQGGLEPDRTLWQTSGYASFTFVDYAELGFGDFNIGQLENYYKAYFVDPGYVDPVVVNLGFIGYYVNDGNVLSTSIHWQTLKKGDMIDWDAVDAAYAAWVAGGGLVPDRTLWLTSGYASFTFVDYAELGFGDFNIGQLEGYYKSYYVDPGYILSGGNDDSGDDSGGTEPGNPEPVDPVFESAVIANYNGNLQDKNNDNLTFVVTVILSDGSTYNVAHAESVNGGQKGSALFDYGIYKVSVTWNDSNWVSSISVAW